MKNHFLRILELLFPSTQDEKNLASVSSSHFISLYIERYNLGIVSLSYFNQPEIRSAIHLNKFHGHRKARNYLGLLLSKYVETLEEDEYLLIPIPLSSKRHRKRGYNQVTVIAENTLKNNSYPQITLATTILTRNKDTKPQTSLSKTDRLSNLKDVFTVSEANGKLVAGKKIILLDDVTTTGTTFREAKAALLLHNPALVICVACAQ